MEGGAAVVLRRGVTAVRERPAGRARTTLDPGSARRASAVATTTHPRTPCPLRKRQSLRADASRRVASASTTTTTPPAPGRRPMSSRRTLGTAHGAEARRVSFGRGASGAGAASPEYGRGGDDGSGEEWAWRSMTGWGTHLERWGIRRGGADGIRLTDDGHFVIGRERPARWTGAARPPGPTELRQTLAGRFAGDLESTELTSRKQRGRKRCPRGPRNSPGCDFAL
jgi:hypothetical protein